MTPNSCSLDDIKALYIRFATAYGHKFTSVHQTSEMVQLWYHEWKEALAGIDRELVVKAFNECKIQLEWPPSMAEIIKSCDVKMGLPNIHDAINLAAHENFTHPVVEKLYLRIGSWEFRNDTSKSLLAKAKLYYPEILAEFRLSRQRKALALEHKPKEVTHDTSHGSEVGGDNIRRVGMRQAQDHLLS